jgi:hypothetical protein
MLLEGRSGHVFYKEEFSFNQYRPSLKTSEVNKKSGCVK